MNLLLSTRITVSQTIAYMSRFTVGRHFLSWSGTLCEVRSRRCSGTSAERVVLKSGRHAR